MTTLKKLVEAAEGKFWQGVVEELKPYIPQITSGDLPTELCERFKDQSKSIIESWIVFNPPEGWVVEHPGWIWKEFSFGYALIDQDIEDRLGIYTSPDDVGKIEPIHWIEIPPEEEITIDCIPEEILMSDTDRADLVAGLRFIRLHNDETI